MFSPESEISLWIKPKRKTNFFCGKFGSIPTFRSTQEGKKCFLWWACVYLTTRYYTTSHQFSLSFFDFARICSLFSIVFRTSKFLEFKEFNKTIIPFALVGYETGYSQLGATRLVGHLPSHARSWNNCYIFPNFPKLLKFKINSVRSCDGKELNLLVDKAIPENTKKSISYAVNVFDGKLFVLRLICKL